MHSINGDGRDDFIFIKNGQIWADINTAEASWNSLGVIATPQLGATAENVQFGDIDGMWLMLI